MQTSHRRQLANAIRALAMDAVQKANSGHPGMPMGMADIAEVLWNDHLKHNPGNPLWSDRDRFVVSNGHGSMLLYSLLHLTGYPLKIEDLQKFRQLGSHTAGHPEHDSHLGIETTTGPLGQGLANAVGMALAEKHLASEFNRPGHDIVDHRTWVFLGDGCLMEGVSHEACSLAGTLGLGKLIAFYDDNGISIDGEVHGWFTDDTPKRFEAYGWHVVPNVDGHDPAAIEKAIAESVAQADKPSLICCKTIIGWGSPNKQGTEATHGAALGADEVAATRKNLGWEYEPFVIPEEIRNGWDAKAQGAKREGEWQQRFNSYKSKFPELAAEYERRYAGELPSSWRDVVTKYVADVAKESKPLATRQSSQASLNAYGPGLPELLGGSADLTGSNNTNRKDSRSITGTDASGNYIHYGVREFGMSAIMNGMALHGGLIPYGGTFLVFSDYARNAMRMSALMKQRVIYVMTHDSIGLGEDGPTHQPVEHLPSLRIIPNMTVWRPCDSTETALAWADSIERRNGPSTLALTRQALPPQSRTDQQIANIRRGGYVLKDSEGTPEVILIATGSEVAVAVEAAGLLQQNGKRVRVVSMPSTNVFDAQDEAYREQVLPRGVEVRVAIEAAATDTWYRYVGMRGAIIGMTTFGASGVAKDLFKHFGFTADNVVRTVQKLLQ
ncbi:transketolase [Steroidobacter agaridevorans]|uniref:Transketolase n=1 Tax=Steroidobacter agaridevorans TaxID=2695856 RepID=A0A829YMS0_9GAMM|nr:transketolase [Steroidobacter agaridevorans]GFE84008.1 transketolase [Steroidobacter agaridevorans]